MQHLRFYLTAPVTLLLLGGLAVPQTAGAQEETASGQAGEAQEPELPVSRERLEELARGYTRTRVGVPTPTPPPLHEAEPEATLALGVEGEARIGEEATLTFTLRTDDGEPLTTSGLAEFREGRRLGLHLVDGGLDDYHRLTPEETDTPGQYAVTFTPMNGGEYTAFLFLRPESTGILETLRATFDVEGSPAAWELDKSYQATVWEHSFNIEFSGPEPRSRRLLRGEFAARNPQGAIVHNSFREVAGDPISLVAISQHRNRAFLAHFPAGIITAEEEDQRPILFDLMVDHPGVWHLFATVDTDERTITVPFRIHAADPQETTTNEEAFEELDRLWVALDQAHLTQDFLASEDIVPLMREQFSTLTGNLGELPERHQTALPSILFRVTQSLDLIDRFAAAEAPAQYSMATEQLRRELNALRQAALVPGRGEWQPLDTAGQCAFGGGTAGEHDMGAHALHRNRRIDFCSFTCAARFHQAPDRHLDTLLEGHATE